MRDYVVLAIILASVPIALFDPFYGVLVWNWIAFFNPHRYTWSFAYNFPVAEVIAVPTLLGVFLSRAKTNKPFFVREVAILLLFWIWCGVTLLYCGQSYELAAHLRDGIVRFDEVSKILLMTFITILLVNSREKLRYLVFVVALSFGIRALIVGYSAIITGGQSKVYGPPDSFIADNNDWGLALNMALPMLFFLGWDADNRIVRWLLRACFVASIVCIILTYSRGALLGMIGVLLYITIKSRHKVVGAILLAVCALSVLTFAPQRWMERMNNFAQGNLDSSAEERLAVWKFTMNFVQAHPVTGGGFEVYEDADIKRRYAPEGADRLLQTGPHSIYFQTLGEQGIVGFVLFIYLLGSCMVTLGSLRRGARKYSSFRWVIPYTHMFQVALVGYAINGAFLGRAYFDLYFTLVACTCIMKIIYKRATQIVDVPEAFSEPQLVMR